jgi:hypothetical protein
MICRGLRAGLGRVEEGRGASRPFPFPAHQTGRADYWKAGSYAPNVSARDVPIPIDVGKLYLTNKRILFLGAHKSNTIKLSAILDFDGYTDGVRIVKSAGKSPVLLGISHDVETFSRVFWKLIHGRSDDLCSDKD